MTEAVAHVTTTISDGLHPLFKGQLPVDLCVDSPDSNSLAAHAWKVGFSARGDSKTTVQDVIPHVQFGDARCVHRRNEVDCGNGLSFRTGDFVCHIDNEFVGPDSVERGNVEVWQFVWAILSFRIRNAPDECGQSSRRVSRATDRSLTLGPTQGI